MFKRAPSGVSIPNNMIKRQTDKKNELGEGKHTKRDRSEGSIE